MGFSIAFSVAKYAVVGSGIGAVASAVVCPMLTFSDFILFSQTGYSKRVKEPYLNCHSKFVQNGMYTGGSIGLVANAFQRIFA